MGDHTLLGLWLEDHPVFPSAVLTQPLNLRADAQHGAATAFVVLSSCQASSWPSCCCPFLFDIFRSGLRQMMGPQEENPSGCLVWFGNI